MRVCTVVLGFALLGLHGCYLSTELEGSACAPEERPWSPPVVDEERLRDHRGVIAFCADGTAGRDDTWAVGVVGCGGALRCAPSPEGLRVQSHAGHCRVFPELFASSCQDGGDALPSDPRESDAYCVMDSPSLPPDTGPSVPVSSVCRSGMVTVSESGRAHFSMVYLTAAAPGRCVARGWRDSATIELEVTPTGSGEPDAVVDVPCVLPALGVCDRPVELVLNGERYPLPDDAGLRCIDL